MASGPSVYFTFPSWEILKFPPDPLPPTLPPPVHERSFRSPFGIQPWLFNLAMRPEVPFGFAILYTLVVFNLNAWNKSRGNKPWWIAEQKAFKRFVIVHNAVLALYSFATFVAMGRAITHSWPGWGSETGAAGVADTLCKLHGPRTLGDAITFNSTIGIWESKNQFIKLTGVGNPDPTDVGRLWNEGLAFWGWIFYLSKFYEVLDTLIIIAKGKRSPTLQTYHHAGAMLCMWAGMRYMSPPIWMFVFVNAGIHTMMYVYFGLAALEVKVPQRVKRSLTTLQIAQFIFGASYAGLHLFVQYDIPIATPYKVAAKVAAAASSASSAVSAASSVVSQAVESPTISASLGVLIKKLLLRAAGEEGVAERIAIPSDRPAAEVIESKLVQVHERIYHQPVFETRYRTEWTKINCIDTSGEAFAIWLNLFYLLPLTLLFARFFIRAYTQRGQKPKNVQEASKQIAQDAKTAELETERAVEDAGKRAEDEIRHRGSDVKRDVKSLHDQLRDDVRKIKSGNYGSRKVSERVESFEKQVKQAAAKVKDEVKSISRRGSPAKREEAPELKEENDDGAKSEDVALAEPEEDENKENEPPVEQAHPEPSQDEGDDEEGEEEEHEEEHEDEHGEEDSKEDKEDEKEEGQVDDREEAKDDDKEDQAPPEPTDDQPPTAETKKVPARDQSAAEQDKALDESEAVRPGASEEAVKDEDDTDAMGKSGIDIESADDEEDTTAEKSGDNKKTAEEKSATSS